MVTIREVATEAGVSIADRFLLFEQQERLRKECQKIAEAIKKLNYIVSSSGRNLRKINQDIGIVFPNIYDPYLEKIIHGIRLLQYQECPAILELTDDDPEKETDIIHELIGKKVAGILLYTCQPNNTDLFSIIEASEIPLC
jgi:multiple sugar transport system substrate-binding protein